MELLYRLAADALVIIHFAFVAAVALGQAVILIGGWRGWKWIRRPGLRIAHLAAILFVVGESWCGVTCPLTTWEHQLRKAAGDSSYKGDFLAHWAHELLFFDFPTWVFTSLYTAFAASVLAAWWWIPPRRTSQNGPHMPNPD